MNRQRQATALVLVALMLFSVAGTGFAAGSPSSVAEVESQPTASIGSGEPAAVTAAAGDVLYRANAGGSFTADGNQWDPLVDYQVAGEDETSSHGQPSTIHSSVPAGTPSQIWETERWDPSDGEEMQYEFDVASGQQVEVRLYFYDGYSGTSSVGDRVFDVAVEGQTVLDDFDIIETYGDDTGAMESFTVTSDGTIDVDFGHVTQNPQVNAIEIVSAEPQSDTLGGPGSVDFGQVLVDNSEQETVTVTNLGGDGDPSIDITDVSVTGSDADEFTAGAASDTSLAPGESADVPVTFSPSSVDPMSATLEISHSGSNSPLTVDLSGEGASAVDPSFQKSKLEGFSAGNPTAIEFGPDGRVYVSTQGGTVYALNVTRTAENSYEVENEVQIDAIKDIPNHDDFGNIDTSEDNRQITGLTVGGTADQPVVYVSSSDPEIDVGQDDDDTDTNSGAISRLTVNAGSGETLQASDVEHDVMALGLPRSEENHATNGLDLTPDGDTLYVAQGGHTNKGAPGDNFGHTPEYALSAAVLEIDLAQIENNHQATSLQTHNSEYPDLDYLYALPTIQGGDLPFGGNDGINQAKLVEGGPVQIYSPGYRNPYDLVLAESGQLYVSDHGPNGGWGGQPADANGNIVADAASVTNHPNEDGSYGTNDQLIAADEGDYAGHAAPIRANPTQADIYDADGNVIFDITSSNSPVPESLVDPRQADYIPPTSGSPDPGAPAGSANTMEFEDGSKVLFGPTGGTGQYTASNFGGAMEGDLLQVELNGNIYRVELSADGETVTNVEQIGNTGGALGISAQDDGEVFPGTIWTANHGGNDVTIFEPVDYGDGDTGEQCDPDNLDPEGDADGDGYSNGDELAVGTDPCSSASTPADFDDDGNPNELDPDDDNDGLDDTEDPFAVDPDNGLDTTLPVQHDLSELSLFGEDGQGWTGLMTNGTDYQDLYDPTQMTVGGAAEVLTVENVPQGDAHAGTNTQQYAFQFGVNPPDEPFTVESTVASFPENPEDFQSAGIYVGTGDQSNYSKLVVAADGGNGGIEFAQEEGDSFTHQTSPNIVSDSNVTGADTTLRLTVDPTTDPMPDNGEDEVALTAEYEVDGETKEVGTAAIPASWLDTSDGTGLAVGVISTSNGASSTFDATWTDISVEYVTPPANQPPTADAGSDQTVDEGQQVTLDGSESSDPDGDSMSYSWTQTAGPSVTLSDADTATPTFTAPDIGADETLTFEVEVSDGEATDTDTVDVTVQDTDVATGDVVFAVNSGGSEYTATGGTVYQADTNFDGGSTYSVSQPINDTQNDPLYHTERYGQNFSYDIPLENGTYQVTLKFAEIYQGVSPQDSPDSTGPEDGTNENDRVFDVTIEGQQVIENKDLYAEVGPLNATEETFTVEVTDGELNVAFPWDSDNYDNAKISAIKIVAVGEVPDDEMTVAEAVASYGDGDDSTISLQEIQTGINWWSTGTEVPNTGGETISLQEIQQLINMWSTGATVGDGGDNTAPTIDPISDQTVTEGDSATVPVNANDLDGDAVSLSVSGPDFVSLSNSELTIAPQSGDAGTYTVEVTADDGQATTTESFQLTVNEPSAATGSAQVAITPDSGTEASTYGGGSFTVENTGDQQISSVTFDLSESAMPDMVFDPDGTAGDQAAKGLNIDSQSGDGVGVVSTADDDVFSQPHNGVNGSDGYDVLTIEFTDFDPGESVSFSADNDPTGIKGATVSSQEAGPVSGLELARSSVSVEYADGSAQETQLFSDGSAGGAQATLDESVAPAPTIDVQAVDLNDGVLRDHHSAATVNEADQTVTVTGQPGETVTLLHFESELELDNVPEYDGTPGYDIEAYEANKIENVDYQTVPLDSNGEAEVPVTLLNTTAVGGYNYFVATQGEPGSDTGLDSNVVVLKYEESAGDGGDDGVTSFAVNAGGDAYTAADGTEFQADANFDGGSTFTTGNSGTPSNPEISNTEDDELYYTERYGDFSYDVPLEDGEYEVTLHFVEIYQGVANDGGEGDRLFNVSIEGQQVLDEYDIYAEAGGAHAAVTETFTTEVTDGELNVDFSTVEDNAKVSAIEIDPVNGDGDDNAAPTIDSIDNQTVTAGETAQVTVNASDDDGDSLTLSVDGPDFVDLTDDGDGTGTLDIAPKDGDAGTYTVEVTADDGTTTTTESFEVAVEEAEAQLLHRVNAGESTTLSATDDGPDWTGVADTSSPHLVSVAPSTSGNYCGGTIDSTTADVPSSTPDGVFDCERYGNATWEFSVDTGQEVEVRLYLGNQFSSTSEPGEREYNVSIEDTQVLTNYDPAADVGHATGTMKSFTVTDDGDGNVTVTFDQGAAENPQVNAIEIVETEGGN
ncbi:malectin domain-containing carbohydrate-binding protein [Halobellus sp. H-GB7]|uniref:malectin domain-containing carbohydrate-binding protein n=1 Tax=Halobellus sp. H-GB7 TaxID=3069756 RepID=UPI0027AEEE2A|nr:malectin domain-containing carbohydrate-binding protein [Halobellus sp. H-GB7]MDQ2054594.1 malectin domain-containing carbohydrate-binding protein [Halobellus sp. H-GB7]